MRAGATAASRLRSLRSLSRRFGTILDRHRASAAKHYRALPETWIVLFLPDDDEIFRRTALAAERKRPDIAPFDRCILLDTAGTVVDMKSAQPVGGGTVA